ncbi:MAG: hypothetical protein P9L99_19775 [Candidatus Lernaella stagnicola]|nr:hypothetical protein [Candidatus Lernaella stagnicola]
MAYEDANGNAYSSETVSSGDPTLASDYNALVETDLFQLRTKASYLGSTENLWTRHTPQYCQSHPHTGSFYHIPFLALDAGSATYDGCTIIDLSDYSLAVPTSARVDWTRRWIYVRMCGKVNIAALGASEIWPGDSEGNDAGSGDDDLVYFPRDGNLSSHAYSADTFSLTIDTGALFSVMFGWFSGDASAAHDKDVAVSYGANDLYTYSLSFSGDELQIEVAKTGIGAATDLSVISLDIATSPQSYSP